MPDRQLILFGERVGTRQVSELRVWSIYKSGSYISSPAATPRVSLQYYYYYYCCWELSFRSSHLLFRSSVLFGFCFWKPPARSPCNFFLLGCCTQLPEIGSDSWPCMPGPRVLRDPRAHSLIVSAIFNGLRPAILSLESTRHSHFVATSFTHSLNLSSRKKVTTLCVHPIHKLSRRGGFPSVPEFGGMMLLPFSFP